MKVVITGGLGFIGIELARKLVAADHNVTLLDNLSVQIHGELPTLNVPAGVKVVRMDISDIAERHDLIEGTDAVIHLASETGTAQSMYQMSHYTKVNCGGTSALLEAIAKCTHRPKRILLASSRSVYGEGAYAIADHSSVLVPAVARSKEALEAGCWEPKDALGRPLVAVPTPECLPFAPGSVYAATKAAQELLVSSASIALGLSATIFRFQNVYGEGQSLRNPYTGIISIFFNRARQELPISVYEDGLESRDFVHVCDIVDTLVDSLNASLPNGIVLNVGSGVSTSVSHLAATLLKVSGFEVAVQITGQYRLGDIRHCYADLTQIKKHLGFRPKVTIENGLRRFCQWAATQPLHEDRSIKAEAELKERGLTRC
jgi:dTDP-L-rhamnose 4-epimerase